MKILVTGATGYVGSALVEDLRKHHEVIATARNPARITHQGVQKLQLDVSSPKQAAEVIEQTKPDVVIHAAALPKRNTSNEEEFIRTNVDGVENIAKATHDHSDAKFVMISSGCAYKQEIGKKIELESEREMGTAFSQSKNLAEDVLVDIFNDKKDKLAIVYPPVILHPSQTQGIIPYALKDACNEGRMTNKLPNGHVNFVTHDKFAELMEAIAKDEKSQDVQRYMVTGNRFSTKGFFTKLQSIMKDTFNISAEIHDHEDPYIETMCEMNETAIRKLEPSFDWGSLDDSIAAIMAQNLQHATDIQKPTGLKLGGNNRLSR